MRLRTGITLAAFLFLGAGAWADAPAKSPADALRAMNGPFSTPAREIRENTQLEYLFDPYDSLVARYKALTGDTLPREVYDAANSGKLMDTTCPTDYPNAPKLKEILMIVWVMQDDFTGRLFNCVLEHHLRKGTRVRAMIGAMSFEKSLIRRYDELMAKYPLFSYRLHDGSQDDPVDKINLSLHVKNFIAIGEDPKDTFLIEGGRNLSDRYYFTNFPIIDHATEDPKKWVWYNDLELLVHDPVVVDDSYRIARLLWHRLPNNYSFDSRLPLETQIKMLYSTDEFDSYVWSEERGFPVYLNTFMNALDILGTLTMTRVESERDIHTSGLSVLPSLHRLIQDLLAKYPRTEIYSEVARRGFKAPKDARDLRAGKVRGTPLQDFRQELYRGLKELMIASGLHPAIQEARKKARFDRGAPFEDWYDGIYASMDALVFKRDLEKIEDLMEILGDRLLDTRGVSRAQLAKFGGKDRHFPNDEVLHKFYEQGAPAAPNSDQFLVSFFSFPTQDGKLLDKTLISLIDASSKVIRLANCFFHPSPGIRDALTRAANRGVEIFITTDTHLTNDDLVGLPEQANRASINRMLKLPNVHFFDWIGKILHPKVYAFDDQVIYIGSANMNRRTMVYNNENGIFLSSSDFVSKFRDDLYAKFRESNEYADVKEIDGHVKEHGLLYKFLLKVFRPLL